MRSRLVICLLLMSLLPGCGSKPRAPVEDRNTRAVPGASQYVVQRGDTLYSIAFRYGMDYRKVAAANNIPAPYTIYPGQRLQLREAAISTAPQPVRSASSSRSVATPPPAPTSSSTEKSAAAPAAVTKPSSATAATSTSPTPQAAPPSRAVDGWRWPTRGRVVRGYSTSVHKGIDIDGKRGDPIYAVAHGTVVYAGTGIVGMGELVIVKHNDIYLSAYAHNDRLLVGEGERVRAGQKIATKGNSGTDEVKLHFEIRKEGKPVNPATLLPRR